MKRLALLSFFVPALLSAQVPDYVPTDGLVAYWPLDGHILDATGNHDGTNSGAVAIEDQSGIADQAMALPAGNDFFDLPGGLATDATDITLSFWAWLSVPSSGAAVLLDRPSVTDNIWSLDYQTSTGTIHFVTRNDDGSGYQNIGNWAMPSEQWTHITTVFRKDSDSKEIYANGELVDSASALFDGFTLPPLRFGEAPEGNNADCRFSDIGLWTRVLSPAEIAGLHAEQPASTLPDHVPTDGLVAWYPLDSTALDESGNGHHLTLDGPTWGAGTEDADDQALLFDGQDDVASIPHHPDFNSPEMSLSFWVNVHTDQLLDSPGFSDFMGMINKTDLDAPALDRRQFDVQLYAESAGTSPFNLGWLASTGHSVNESDVELVTAPANLPAFEWNHIVVTASDSTLSIHINSEHIATNALLHPRVLNTADILIGRDYLGLAQRHFNGRIDDIAFYNRVLTAEEIEALFDSTTESDNSENAIELLIVGATGEETATREALEAYQLDATLTDRDLSITEVDFQDSISPCGQWDALLENKDAALFLGTANLDNCSWEDIIPALDNFMRAGGEIYLQAENSYSMVTHFDGNGSTWPEYWHDHMTEAEAANWFGTAFTAQQLWCCGMASTNVHCSDNANVLGISHDCNPLFAGIYDYPFGNECTGWLGEPWLFEVPSEETTDGIGFSVFQFGGDPADPGNPNNALAGTEAVFGRTFDSGHLIVLGDNQPGFGYEGSRNLLGNLIHGLSHPSGLSDLIVSTTDCTAPPAILGCTDAAACNYDPAATEDDGSCQLPPTIGWSADTSICAMPFVLDAGAGFDAYLWNTGDTTQAITTFQEGLYSVEVSDTGTRDDYSLQFDGQDDYVDVPDIDLTSVTQFTFCASARLVDETGTDFYNILSSGENGPEQLQWGINNNDLRMAFYHADINPVESNVAIERFEWYHTAVVYDGTDLILYLNAEEVQRQSVTLNLTQSVRFIGQWLVDSDNLGAREPWHGQLDHVGIWNTALSQNQIAQRMSCPNSPGLDGLMARWNFEADAGNVVSGDGDVVSIGTVIGANYSALVPDNLCPGCSATDSIHVTVDFDCLYCGEGTEWDEDSQQCIAVDSEPTPSCGEGTVWDPVAEECIIAVPTDTDFDGCVTAGDVLNLLATFGTCPPIPFSGPCQGLDHVTYHGHDYAIVAIGDQCWFAENLRSAFFRNGEAIPTGLDTESWTQATTPAMTHYAADDSVAYGSEDATGNQLQYGNFYNGYAVQDSRGLCPSGWTVPTDTQWMELESYLGMDSIALAEWQYRPGAGHQISNSPSDTPPWSGNNLTGWSGTPGGARSGNYGYYFEESLVGYFWGRDDNWSGGSLPYRALGGGDAVYRANRTPRAGFSIRCLKD